MIQNEYGSSSVAAVPLIMTVNGDEDGPDIARTRPISLLSGRSVGSFSSASFRSSALLPFYQLQIHSQHFHFCMFDLSDDDSASSCSSSRVSYSSSSSDVTSIFSFTVC